MWMSNKAKEILTAAMRLFSEVGYHGSSMRAIAREAGIVQSSIYNHFASKEEVLREIANMMGEEVAKTFRVDPALPPPKKMEVYRKNLAASLRTQKQFWRLIHTLRMNADIREVLGPQMAQMEGMILQQIGALLSAPKKRVKPEEVLLFWAGVDGAAAAFLMIENYPLEKVLKLLFQKFL